VTRDEIIDYFNIEEPVLFFDPAEVFDKGIIGISEDHCHIIYGYWALVTALAEDYERLWKKEHNEVGGAKNSLTFITKLWNGLITIQSDLCLMKTRKSVQLLYMNCRRK